MCANSFAWNASTRLRNAPSTAESTRSCVLHTGLLLLKQHRRLSFQRLSTCYSTNSRSGLLWGGSRGVSEQRLVSGPVTTRKTACKAYQRTEEATDVVMVTSAAVSRSALAWREFADVFRQHWRHEKMAAPSQMSDALFIFAANPSVLLISSVTTALLLWRVTNFGASYVDAVAVVVTVAFWLMQEWVIHRYLLHSSFEWPGKRIHESHHADPYFHVTIDGLNVVVPMLLLVPVVWTLVYGTSAAAITATITYYIMGLLYEWTHYIVHTRVVPKSSLLRAIRVNHMMHHCRNENYWLSFTVPWVDALFGTAPHPRDVPITPTASKAQNLGHSSSDC